MILSCVKIKIAFKNQGGLLCNIMIIGVENDKIAVMIFFITENVWNLVL